MRRSLFIILAVCALSAATALSRHARAPPPEKDTVTYCAPQTPCGWAFYNSHTFLITLEIKNTYCECDPGSVCEKVEKDTEGNVFIKRCQRTPQS